MGLFNFKKKKETGPLQLSERTMSIMRGLVVRDYGQHPYVIHDTDSQDIHIDILVVLPIPERNYYTLITMGMSAYKMEIPLKRKDEGLDRCELMMNLPPDWNIKSEDERDFWPIRALRTYARMPMSSNTWFGLDHTIANINYEPFASNTKLCGFYFDSSPIKNFWFKDIEKVNYYTLIPLYKEEFEYSKKYGTSKLLNLLKANNLLYPSVVNINRNNMCISTSDIINTNMNNNTNINTSTTNNDININININSPLQLSEQNFKLLDSFLINTFRQVPNVFHETNSQDIHIDILVFSPTTERNYYTLITMGMSAYKMEVPLECKKDVVDRCELVINLPPNWNIQSTVENDYWPIRALRTYARMPMSSNTWFDLGHTIANTNYEPFAPNTKLCGFSLTSAPIQVFSFNATDKVCFYTLVPLYKEELDYSIKNGYLKLLDLFQANHLPYPPVVDINRNNMCINDQQQ